MDSTDQTQDPPECRNLLRTVESLDFSDTKSKEFSSLAKQIARPENDELLHTLARRAGSAFYATNGDGLLQWIFTSNNDIHDPYRLLHIQMEDNTKRTPIHEAIFSKNHGFLDCLLSMAGDPDSRKPALSAEIVSALRTRDEMRGGFTCLHASIAERLPCVPKMIELCAQVEGRDPDTLTNIVKRRDIDKRGFDGAGLESIFLMRDRFGNTPLHLVMETSDRPWSTTTRPQGTSITGSSSIPKSLEYRPSDVITRISNLLGCDMGAQWTSINGKGQSPYKKLMTTRRSLQNPDKSFQEKVRATIFYSITEIPHLKRALYGTKEKELCLDMSDFNQSSHDFKTFVFELKKSPQKGLLFEECLISVFLPDLNTFQKVIPHEGVPELFEWLSKEAGVKRLKSLNIPDSTTSPMSDELVVGDILDRFEIEKFDWRKLDINLDAITRSKNSKEFTEITLYSTGNFSVLYHWVSPEGLATFPNLRKVTIEIVKLDSLSESQKQRHIELVTEYQKKVNSKLDQLKVEKKKQKPPIEFNYVVKPNAKWEFPASPYSHPVLNEKLELIKKLDACHDFLKRLRNTAKEKTQHKTYLSRLDALTQKDDGVDNQRLIKVAVIDNGADKFRLKIRDVIEKGVSYVKADAESTNRILPWWMVSDPHGTQMASLIADANPWCRLYIARVGKSRKDILPEDAVQAIKWAIEQQVDVISISWVTKRRFDELEAAIKEATKHALVFCSTADEGTWSGNVYPANYEGTVRVSATDKYGNLMPASDKNFLNNNAINIPVPGEDIPALGPSYMGEGIARGTVSGSSVATAMAAGIASLALLLLQVFNDVDKKDLAKEEFYTNEGIVRVLSKINSTNDSPSLFPTSIETKYLPERWDIGNFKK